MSFNVSDNKLLKKYNKIWEKISYLMKIKFDYGDNDKYIKTRMKLYGDKMNANLQSKIIRALLLEQIKNSILKHF